MRHSHPLTWIDDIAWACLAMAFVSAGVIAWDIFGRGYRQKMPIMDAVWPITALYWGPVAVWQYFKRGRVRSKPVLAAIGGMDHAAETEGGQQPQVGGTGWWPLSKAVSHCGAGCTLGDIVAEWIVFATGFTLAGIALPADMLLDFVLAWGFGIVFQYFTIAPMRGVSGFKGIGLAIRADTLSILAFQLGLFAWMALSAKVIWTPPLGIDTSAHWWMMQTGMIVGFCTSWPVNRWLVSRGWKEKMDHRPHVADMVDARSGRGRRRPPRPAATG